MFGTPELNEITEGIDLTKTLQTETQRAWWLVLPTNVHADKPTLCFQFALSGKAAVQYNGLYSTQDH